ncbi:unnamed protein product [Somion occarium]|uniref:Uncharacterized protein n=1 Tax=Somion occarium TaxID=3059160 RepID=A0ABP1CJX8_9APHY
MTSQSFDLPYYVLVSHAPGASGQTAPSSTTFSHPIIEYHYADDSPRNLLPREPSEHVLVLDYNVSEGATPDVKSLSADLAVAGLRIAEAPGAAAHEDGNIPNNKMFVIDTINLPEEIVEEDQFESAQAVLARFKQRNAILHRAFDYARPADQSSTDVQHTPTNANPPEER